jgi:YidC/Oxa1 family membrane protein insertase
MTDMRRMILLGLLFLVGMMLWNAWEVEHAPKPAVVSPLAQASSSEVITAPAAPAAVPVPPPLNLNIPDRYVTIKNQVMEAMIDRAGGNLVNVKLLKYPVASNQPDKPFNLLSNDPSTYYIAISGIKGLNIPASDQMIFNAVKKDHQVILSWQNKEGLKITKTYVFSEDDYLIQLNQTLTNQGTTPWQGNTFTALQRKPDNGNGMGPFNFNTYTGAVISSPEKRYEKVSFKQMADQNIDRTAQNGWIAMVQHYFLTAWVPKGGENYHYYSYAGADNLYTIGAQSPLLQIAPDQQVSTSAQLYAGPELGDKLGKIAPGLELTVDYGVLWFIAVLIFGWMKKIHSIVGNWGWSIVLVTLTIKLVFYKLNSISFRSMAKMRELQPKLEQVRERCGDDRQKLGQATMELYRKEKINPLSGCLPLIVQIPVFLALYWVLVESVELRQAPFILWIHDLSVKDPYYILPLLMGLTIFIQQWLSPKAADPMQRKVMMMMPIIFTALFFTFPAGLVLYWVVNNTLSILQQWYIMNHVVPKSSSVKK